MDVSVKMNRAHLMQESAAALKAKGVRVLPARDTLYVMQHEFAVVPVGACIKITSVHNLRHSGDTQYVCSDEATTCHIIIARNTTSLATFLCHFDGHDIGIVTRSLTEFASESEGSNLTVSSG